MKANNLWKMMLPLFVVLSHRSLLKLGRWLKLSKAGLSPFVAPKTYHYSCQSGAFCVDNQNMCIILFTLVCGLRDIGLLVYLF